MATIKGYKVFNPDWTSQGIQYKIGETFECNKNINFCCKATNCLLYCECNPNNKIAEVEATDPVETYAMVLKTNKIKIVREIEWQELLAIIKQELLTLDTGFSNTGDYNTGENNTGNHNAGNRNTGNSNGGDNNTGDNNIGDHNTGKYNVGSYNVGCWNTGGRNTGNWNTGDWNTGEYNTGDWNTGKCNTGVFNTGSYNTGRQNTGMCNTGNRNSGSWNKTDFNSGFFTNIDLPIFMFNKPTTYKSHWEINNLKGMIALDCHFKDRWWVRSENMTDEEKAAHPEHETTGGYLKIVDFKTACEMMWSKLSDDEKLAVMQLPNFDAEVFEDITGINVNSDDLK